MNDLTDQFRLAIAAAGLLAAALILHGRSVINFAREYGRAVNTAVASFSTVDKAVCVRHRTIRLLSSLTKQGLFPIIVFCA